MNKKFVNLHCHDFYSIGDAICSPEEVVKKAKELGMNALATTNHGTLASWVQFKEACTKHNVKPIFGVEAYFVDSVTDVYAVSEEISVLRDKIKVLGKDKTKPGKVIVNQQQEKLLELQNQRGKLKKYNHLILLAKNFEGSQNLVKIHNDAVLDGVYYKPRIDWNVLERHRGGIIATSACLGGRLSKLLAQDAFEDAIDAVGRFKGIFGLGNFYLELQLHDIKLQTEVNTKMIKLAEVTNTPCVITCDSHYLNEGDHTTRALIRNLDKEPDEIVDDDALIDLYIKNEDMLLQSWRKYMPGHSLEILANAIINTREIADSIENFPFDSSLKFPLFDTGEIPNQEDFVALNAWRGLTERGLADKFEYVDRLKFELNTVNKLGFASYFNVVSDLVKDAKRYQSVGPGRGSAAGSLLSYCLKITDVDPIKFSLYFERFLSADRGIMAPTFGIALDNVNVDYNEIMNHSNCECHKK